jgi:RNA polymerase sigma-70 factor, ECF subfamily
MTPAVSNAKTADAELVARIRAGDEGACEALVRAHAGALLTVARRFLRCEADRADAVQEAFILAFRAIDSFEGNSALSSWLHRIVVNRCLGRLRILKRRRTVSLDELRPACDERGRNARPESPWALDGENQLVRAEMRARVRACIDQLPDAYRMVLVLRDIEEFDTDQTARRLGSTPGAVKTRLHRARQALRSLLEPVFGIGATGGRGPMCNPRGAGGVKRL